ncbi:retropepsin-like domain-containing protein [bacterium]|nr:retropepsin-like domain-containing protein [bacterium]
MSVIEKSVRLVGSKGEKEVSTLFDSGSTYSCILPELAEKLGILEPLPEPMEFGIAEDEKKVTAKERVSLNFHLNSYRFSDEFMLIPSLSEEALIGAATMQKWRMKLDFEHDEVIIDPKVTKLRLLKEKVLC